MNAQQYQDMFETYLLTEKRVTQNTFTAYQNDITQLREYLTQERLSAAALTTQHLKKYVQHMHKKKLAARTLARKISSLKLFYQFLNERYGITNAAKSLVFPKIEKKLPLYLTEPEVMQLLDAARSDDSPRGVRNLVMIHLLYASGMRISELTNLKKSQIHFDTGFLSVQGKGNKQRDVPLPDTVMQTVSYYVETIYPRLVSEEYAKTPGSKYMFASVRSGKVVPISRQAFWMILKKLLIQAGIKKNVSPHTLRHSLATHLLNAGADVRSLQMLLGHEQVDTVDIYTHLESRQLRKIYDHKHPRA